MTPLMTFDSLSLNTLYEAMVSGSSGKVSFKSAQSCKRRYFWQLNYIFDACGQVKGHMQVNVIWHVRARSVVILMKFAENPPSHGRALGTNVIARRKKEELDL